MKPAWSIIVFTVLSGFGLGLAGALTLASGLLPDGAVWKLAALAGVATAAGLAASVGHLANPKNAWRAMFRLRTSWLSREAALAVLFFPALAAWAFCESAGGECARHSAILRGAVLVLAAGVVFCTAMIYASLKTVRLWRTPLTPLNYILLAAASGTLPVAAASGAGAGGTDGIPPALSAAAAALIVAAAAGTFARFRRADSDGPLTAGAATGLGAANVRLLESGHTGGNFLTREFVYRPSPARVRTARKLAAVLGFGVPLCAAAAAFLFPASGWVVAGMWFSVAGMLSGLLAERWLFFAEARHAVRLYHGDGRN